MAEQRKAVIKNADMSEAMQQDAGLALQKLRVDGGASANNYLMQFQSDIMGTAVERPKITETTALGAAYLAGLPSDFYTHSQIIDNWQCDASFVPEMESEERQKRYQKWQKAVERCKDWELD